MIKGSSFVSEFFEETRIRSEVSRNFASDIRKEIDEIKKVAQEEFEEFKDIPKKITENDQKLHVAITNLDSVSCPLGIAHCLSLVLSQSKREYAKMVKELNLLSAKATSLGQSQGVPNSHERLPEKRPASTRTARIFSDEPRRKKIEREADQKELQEVLESTKGKEKEQRKDKERASSGNETEESKEDFNKPKAKIFEEPLAQTQTSSSKELKKITDQ